MRESLTADVVVVGSGSAGAVVTRRLVDAGVRVALVEAGGADENPAIHDPPRLFELWDSPQDWGYRTVPQAACRDRELQWPRGKVLGGSSSLNGMIYIRGHRSDFDTWAYLGCAGWSYDDVLPVFKRSEDFDRGASDYHGAGGPLPVLTTYEPHAVEAALVDASVQAGIPFNDDHNGATLDGVGYGQMNIRDGVRQSAATAFLRPVVGSPNLVVLTGTRVVRLLLERGRCVGAAVSPEGGSTVEVRAEHEVVVCAGTIESPKLLLLSGIGSGPDLDRLGLDVAVDLPGVGRNLHDHVLSPVIHSSARPVPPALTGLTQLHAHLFWRSRPGLVGPDIQPLFFHLPMYLDGMTGPADGFTLMAGAIRPASRGALRLASVDPEAAPVLDPAVLSCEVDVDTMVAAIELCREIARQDALGDWRGPELYPGSDVTGERLRDYVRQTAITYHHQAGTCRMGVDELAVVDPELRVYGVDGLRVADASVMPFVTSGNTHAPVVMIGERASDFVLAGIRATTAGAAVVEA
jgi:choline dehydrogenase